MSEISFATDPSAKRAPLLVVKGKDGQHLLTLDYQDDGTPGLTATYDEADSDEAARLFLTQVVYIAQSMGIRIVTD